MHIINLMDDEDRKDVMMLTMCQHLAKNIYLSILEYERIEFAWHI